MYEGLWPPYYVLAMQYMFEIIYLTVITCIDQAALKSICIWASYMKHGSRYIINTGNML